VNLPPPRPRAGADSPIPPIGAQCWTKIVGRLNDPFKIEADSEGALQIVSVSGELDQGTEPQLREALATALDRGDGPVLVNLTACRFIDSTGLGLLVEAKRRLGEAQRRFAVCCPDEDVRRLLELTGIDEAVGLFDTLDEAVAALAGDSAS